MLVHEKCEDRFKIYIESGEKVGAVICDPPFSVSELAGGEKEIGGFDNHKPFQREFGSWDFGYSPLPLLEMAAEVTKPGGWLIVKSGDVNFGMVREMGERSPKTLRRYAEFFRRTDCIDDAAWAMMNDGIDEMPRYWEYRSTVCWHKTNPAPKVRQFSLVSSCEWIQILKRLDGKGESAKSLAFNWLGQNASHNHIEGPRCQEPERLYWHKVDDAIVPCLSSRTCPLCKEGVARLKHPAQTPLYVWRWIFARFTVPGMKIYDPYSGLGTTIIAAEQSNFGLEIDGSEMDPDFVKVHQLWKEGKWKLPVLTETAQVEM